MLVSVGRLRLVRDCLIRLGWATPASPNQFLRFLVFSRRFSSTILASSNVFGAAAFGVLTSRLFNYDSYNLERTRLFNEWKMTVDIDLDMGGDLMINLFRNNLDKFCQD